MEIQVQVLLVGGAPAGEDELGLVERRYTHSRLIIALGNIIAVCRAIVMKTNAL
jgi:hypothetical protein